MQLLLINLFVQNWSNILPSASLLAWEKGTFCRYRFVLLTANTLSLILLATPKWFKTTYNQWWFREGGRKRDSVEQIDHLFECDFDSRMVSQVASVPRVVVTRRLPPMRKRHSIRYFHVHKHTLESFGSTHLFVPPAHALQVSKVPKKQKMRF